jgi:hypothetical protein
MFDKWFNKISQTILACRITIFKNNDNVLWYWEYAMEYSHIFVTFNLNGVYNLDESGWCCRPVARSLWHSCENKQVMASCSKVFVRYISSEYVHCSQDYVWNLKQFHMKHLDFHIGMARVLIGKWMEKKFVSIVIRSPCKISQAGVDDTIFVQPLPY